MQPNGKKLFGLLLFLPFVLSSCFNSICDDRQTVVPKFSIYPASTLINEVKTHDSPGMGIIEYYYQTDHKPQDVAEFYSKIIYCSDLDTKNGKLLCNGKAEPFGNYEVYIDYNASQGTIYTIELSWFRCGAEPFE
jgi:hypothetical protein